MKRVRFFALLVVILSCGVALAEEAGGAEEAPGLFSGTIGDALWTVVSFAALLVVLTRVAWRPLLNSLNARQSRIEQQLKSAEEARQRADHMLDDYKQQGLTLVREATEEAQRQQQQAAEKARQEAMAIRRRTQEEIESTQAAAVEELWRQTGDIVLRVGSEVLERTLTPEDNQRLIDEAVARIRQSGGPQ